MFDVDGVLADPTPALAVAWSEVAEKFHVEISVKDYVSWIGLPLQTVMEKVFGSAGSRDLATHVFEAAMSRSSRLVDLFPNVSSVIGMLASNGIQSWAFTSKPRSRAIDLCERAGISAEQLVAGDDLPTGLGKPHPAGLLKVVKCSGIPREQIIFLGDTAYDLQSAARARVFFCHAKWGFQSSLTLPEGTPSFETLPEFARYVLTRSDETYFSSEVFE
ncbi:HAD hydrolase-like protein [Pontimonas sp.]|nr:HAD hydrolase-like protein [Pontimonas sp.]